MELYGQQLVTGGVVILVLCLISGTMMSLLSETHDVKDSAELEEYVLDSNTIEDYSQRHEVTVDDMKEHLNVIDNTIIDSQPVGAYILIVALMIAITLKGLSMIININPTRVKEGKLYLIKPSLIAKAKLLVSLSYGNFKKVNMNLGKLCIFVESLSIQITRTEAYKNKDESHIQFFNACNDLVYVLSIILSSNHNNVSSADWGYYLAEVDNTITSLRELILWQSPQGLKGDDIALIDALKFSSDELKSIAAAYNSVEYYTLHNSYQH